METCPATGNTTSCRNRHCPQCGSRAKDAWLQGRLADVLNGPMPTCVHAAAQPQCPVPVPPALGHRHRLPAPPKHCLSSRPMRVGWGWWWHPRPSAPVLHTWTQDLRLHIHVHAVMACGVLVQDDQGQGRWHTPIRKPDFRSRCRPCPRCFGASFGGLGPGPSKYRHRHDPQGGARTTPKRSIPPRLGGVCQDAVGWSSTNAGVPQPPHTARPVATSASRRSRTVKWFLPSGVTKGGGGGGAGGGRRGGGGPGGGGGGGGGGAAARPGTRGGPGRRQGRNQGARPWLATACPRTPARTSPPPPPPPVGNPYCPDPPPLRQCRGPRLPVCGVNADC
ncbi:transposase zinc-binding domain-containing protein [Candidatus Aalborgicola defluviihabitans]|uniref:transposase zinc-binding domain-containing protein n=1 Tax=Candidatus Aalborgicola defluviihabitans TaxID=3386187 RepID=UPI0039B98857